MCKRPVEEVRARIIENKLDKKVYKEVYYVTDLLW